MEVVRDNELLQFQNDCRHKRVKFVCYRCQNPRRFQFTCQNHPGSQNSYFDTLDAESYPYIQYSCWDCNPNLILLLFGLYVLFISLWIFNNNVLRKDILPMFCIQCSTTRCTQAQTHDALKHWIRPLDHMYRWTSIFNNYIWIISKVYRAWASHRTTWFFIAHSFIIFFYCKWQKCHLQ